MSISNVAHKNVFESNVRKWEVPCLRTAENSGNERKTAQTSLSILFVIIWAPVGVKTSVLVWQGLGSTACAKGKNWRGLKAAQQYVSVVFMFRNMGLAASPASDFGLGSPCPHMPHPPQLAPFQDHPKAKLKVVKGDAGLAGVLNPAGFNLPLDFGHHQSSSALRSCVSYLCAWPFPPGHPPCPRHVWSQTSKPHPPGYFCTEQLGKLPAWMVEPCALKHRLVFVVIFNAQWQQSWV